MMKHDYIETHLAKHEYIEGWQATANFERLARTVFRAKKTVVLDEGATEETGFEAEVRRGRGVRL